MNKATLREETSYNAYTTITKHGITVSKVDTLVVAADHGSSVVLIQQPSWTRGGQAC